jgi:hypothetical protein
MTPSAFFQACGGREAIRFDAGGERSFAAPVILAGCDPRCDIVVPNGRTGIALAFILFDGRLFALPLGSGEPILRNDAELCRAGWVEEGDVFHFDHFAVRPLNPRQPGGKVPDFDPLTSDGARSTDLHFEPRPEFRSRKAPPRLAVLPRLTIIGRYEPARFKINYDGVEPIHAAILRTDSGPWLVDLALRNSTLVNDGPVSAARLRSGDCVSIGNVELIAHVGGDDRSAPPTIVVAAPSPDASVAPILQQVAQFQQQTFEQFREMLGSVTEMVGSLMSEHRQFVREELARLERTALPAAPAQPQLKAAPPPAKPFIPPATVTPIHAPGPGASAPPPNVGLHLWLQEQIGNLEKSQSSRWQRLVERFRKK